MRAHKEHCKTCGRVIPQGGKCPLAPHMLMKAGPVKVLRPIKVQVHAA